MRRIAELVFCAWVLLVAPLSGQAHAAVALVTDRTAFHANANAIAVAFPTTDMTGSSLAIGSITVRDADSSTIGLEVPPYGFVDPPVPLPPPPTTSIIGINGEDDFVLEFGTTVSAVALGIVTNVDAVEVLTVHGLGEQVLFAGSIDALTSPNSIFFLGILSTDTITRISLDTAGGATQNEVIFEIIVGDTVSLPPPPPPPPPPPQADLSALENPTGVVSGLGAVSGWKCIAGLITARFNGGPFILVSYGSDRLDTQVLCGDRANGFVLLVNYNTLGDGAHLIELFDDGVLFASRVFMVVTPGAEFLTGVEAEIQVPDFPGAGQTATLRWNQAAQRFELIEIITE